MRNEKIVTAWNRLNPDRNTKERIFQNLRDRLETNNAKNIPQRTFPRFAIGLLALFVVLVGSFGTAYAASATFRDYVHTLFFPRYTPEEIVSIGNGHMTGSFDEIDVLRSFLDKWNRLEFGNSVTAKENGNHYSLFMQNKDQLQAFVDSNDDGYCIVVYIERSEYEGTEGIWQVTGYQIVENEDAEIMKNQLEPYTDE